MRRGWIGEDVLYVVDEIGEYGLVGNGMRKAGVEL